MKYSDNQLLQNNEAYISPLDREFAARRALKAKVLAWRGITEKAQPITCDRCQVVASDKAKFVVHHRHYRTYGKERLEDVCLLCRACHAGLHERSQNKGLQIDDIPFVDPLWEPKIRYFAEKNFSG